MWLFSVSDSFTERDLDEAKLRAFKALDAPVAPSGRGAAYFSNNELDDDTRQVSCIDNMNMGDDKLLQRSKKFIVCPFYDVCVN